MSKYLKFCKTCNMSRDLLCFIVLIRVFLQYIPENSRWLPILQDFIYERLSFMHQCACMYRKRLLKNDFSKKISLWNKWFLQLLSFPIHMMHSGSWYVTRLFETHETLITRIIEVTSLLCYNLQKQELVTITPLPSSKPRLLNNHHNSRLRLHKLL